VRTVVVVGAGLAGLRAAEALRGRGFDGRLVLAGAESELPYDRPPLSKQVLTGEWAPESAALRDAEHFERLSIELLLDSPASSLDLGARTVTVGGRPLGFDGLILATGATPRRLPGADGLAGVHVLRSLDDARAVRRALEGSPRVVVIGAGFIGGEVAASARSRGLDVTILEAQPAPLTRVLGEQMGLACAGLHRDHGVRLITGAGVRALEGDGRVERVMLADGSRLEADLVVVGIGVTPSTAWLEGSGLELRDGVVCDATLGAGAPGVFAAGDVARWPNPLFDATMRCEQWTNAVEQGRHAARNLLAGAREATPFAGSNYFWSDQYGIRIQFAGVPFAQTVQVVAGDPAEHRFLALYGHGGRLVGALAMRSPRDLMRAKLLIERRAGWDEALAELASGAPAGAGLS
jgi:NADPH-dependent 2,4-dienoyl-CoA reductase/sulfur reductase-like enzyme